VSSLTLQEHGLLSITESLHTTRTVVTVLDVALDTK
jgi:hypothetical protein